MVLLWIIHVGTHEIRSLPSKFLYFCFHLLEFYFFFSFLPFNDVFSCFPTRASDPSDVSDCDVVLTEFAKQQIIFHCDMLERGGIWFHVLATHWVRSPQIKVHFPPQKHNFSQNLLRLTADSIFIGHFCDSNLDWGVNHTALFMCQLPKYNALIFGS